MRDVKKTALYFPEIAVPSEEWLAQAALFYDEVSSIVPRGLEPWTKGDIRALKERGSLRFLAHPAAAEQLAELHAEGMYRPLQPEEFLDSYSAEREEFVSDCLAAFSSSRFRDSLGKPEGWLFTAPVSRRKGTYDLFETLKSAGLVIDDPNDSDWLLFERSSGHLYISVLAKHLAAWDREDTVACTSTSGSTMRDISYRYGDNSTGTTVAEVIFNNALPCPRPGTPMSKILQFKRKRKDELFLFRQEMSAFEDKLSKAESREEILGIASDFADKKYSALAILNKQRGDGIFEVVSKSVEAVLQLRSPIVALATGAAAMKIDKIADVPTTYVAGAAAAYAALQVGLTVATTVRQAASKQNGAAFSYVHHVGKEL